MEITKALCLSVAHISPATAQWLDSPSPPFTVWSSEYGWFMFCHLEMEGIPEDLRICMGRALNLGCEFLRLDCDGPVVDFMQVYDW